MDELTDGVRLGARRLVDEPLTTLTFVIVSFPIASVNTSVKIYSIIMEYQPLNARASALSDSFRYHISPD